MVRAAALVDSGGGHRTLPVSGPGGNSRVNAAAEVEFLSRGAERVISPEELERKLAAASAAGRPLRIKLGLDPSAPDIHLGHTVVLRKARDFQDMGHTVHIIIGDFTGRIGDPSGKSEARRQLDADVVGQNAATYVQQVERILDPRRTRVHFNAEWLAPLDFTRVLELAAKTTVARLLERDDFATRMREERPIHLHEFFYALMQGYDSVAIEADVELGGTDQTFNLMMAREIQRGYGQPPEVAMTMPLLVGLDGVQKMSKSLGNYVGITERPRDMFGKLMSLPDRCIGTYLLTCTRVPAGEVAEMERGMAAGTLNPRDAKIRLAREVTALYHGPDSGAAEEAEFLRVFSQGALPAEMPERSLPAGWTGTAVDLLMALALAPSRSEARRLVQGGAVEVDGVRLAEPAAAVTAGDGAVVRAGKRAFCRVRRTDSAT